jgi:hypothetical protein
LKRNGGQEVWDPALKNVDTEWFQLLLADQMEPIDLTKVLGMRFTLIHVGSDEHRVAWTSHHILLDGWSRQIVISEVLTLYKAYTLGEQPNLSAPVQYGSYLDWILSKDHATAEDFWRRELLDLGDSLSILPQPEPEMLETSDRSFKASCQEQLVLEHSLTKQLNELCRRRRITSHTVGQAAWLLSSVLIWGVRRCFSALLPQVDQETLIRSSPSSAYL